MITVNFKEWVESHNPNIPWDFNNPEKLTKQLARVIGETGAINLAPIFDLFFADNETGLTIKQNDKFMTLKEWENEDI